METAVSGIAGNALHPLAIELEKNYYTVIELLCHKIRTTENPQEAIANAPAAFYHRFSMATAAIVSTRQQEFVPYLMELSVKNNEGHNCSTCSGKCSVFHGRYIVELHDSHGRLRAMIHEANRLADDSSNTMPAEVISLSELLGRMIATEESVLLPLIREAQNNINVRG